MLLQSTSHMKEAAPGAAASEEVFAKRKRREGGRNSNSFKAERLCNGLIKASALPPLPLLLLLCV